MDFACLASTTKLCGIDMILYLDMDGVLCDLDGRYFELFGERPDDEEHRKKHFWDNWKEFVDGNNFTNLTPHRDAKAILDMVKGLKIPAAILSSSGGGYSHDMVIAQKRMWLANHGITYPAYFVPGGRYKAKYADPNAALIDDMERNITLFCEAGGVGIHHTNVVDTVNQLYNFYKEKI